MDKCRIGIIGVGVLGSAIAAYFHDRGYEFFCYDKNKKIGSIGKINKADAIFICVPTPRKSDNSCDVSIVDEAISYIQGNKIVIIKSTVIPGTTDAFQIKYPQHQVLFNPEFLTERRAVEDFTNPKLQILGITAKSQEISKELIKILPRAQYNQTIPAAAAELFKYFRNSYLAMKNSFANQIFDLCKTTGVDYDYIKNCAEADPWIGPEHLNPIQDGFRGFNGKCLPKDTEALLFWASQYQIDLSVLRKAVEYNSRLLESQGIKKDS
ncbi:MAG: hypothetical protein Q7S78_00050 [Candidatus Azambacteria bacterium]|nr:hypothetical protein [Candidatus Azambacteria bacterium]